MADIKISDLSIGDWVYQKMDDGAYQVQWVEREMVGLIKHTGTEEDGSIRLTAVPLSFIEPIPLTPEILEKNGFVRGEYSEIRVYNEWEIGECSDPPYASVRLDIDRQVIRVTNRGRDMFIAEKEVYVHQLQHALRLAGVEKEIEL